MIRTAGRTLHSRFLTGTYILFFSLGCVLTWVCTFYFYMSLGCNWLSPLDISNVRAGLARRTTASFCLSSRQAFHQAGNCCWQCYAEQGTLDTLRQDGKYPNKLVQQQQEQILVLQLQKRDRTSHLPLWRSFLLIGVKKTWRKSTIVERWRRGGKST